MSQENVKIMRSYFELVGRLLDEYWAKPEVPLSESPVLDQGAFDLVHPDAEWKTPVMREAVRGRALPGACDRVAELRERILGLALRELPDCTAAILRQL